MNKVQSKHYSLLLQDENDSNEHILSIHNDKITMSDDDNDDFDEDNDDDDDDDGFKSMIGEDEDQEVDVDEEEDDDDIEEVGSDEEIFGSSQHRILANDGMRHGGQCNFGRKNDYHLLTSNDLEHKTGGVGFEPSINAIWTPTPMSPVRRAFFLASIMFGVLVVAMFLWALPCDVQPCDNEIKLKPRQWFTEIDYIGLNYSQLMEKINGDLTVFLSFYKVDKVLDALPKNKSDVALEPRFNITPSGCGLLSLEEKTGNQNWKRDLEECPAHINCDMMDATGDSLNDCIVLGHGSMAMMFEPIYGSIFWHIHIHNKDEGTPPSFSTSDFHYHLPIALQDLNSDGFAELLFPVVELPTTFLRTKKKSHLMLVSGRSGAVIGKPFSIGNCYEILEVFREDVSIGYTCTMENRSELTGKIPLTTLLNEIEKGFGHDLRNDSVDFDSSRKAPEVNDAICQVRHLNEGRCPYCKTRIEFGLSTDNPMNQEYENARVVSWRVFSNNNACKGAILKLWKWDVNSLQKAFQEGAPPTPPPAAKESDSKDEDFDSSPSKSQSYPSLYNDGLDPTFHVDKYAYEDDYNEKEGPNAHEGDPVSDSFGDRKGNVDPISTSFSDRKGNVDPIITSFDDRKGNVDPIITPFGGRKGNVDPIIPSFSDRKGTEGGGSDFLTRNRHNRNIVQLSDSKSKRFYEHPAARKRKSKMAGNHGNFEGQDQDANNPTMGTDYFIRNQTSENPLGNMTSFPFSTLTAPTGYRLQKLEEVLVLLSFNGTDWVTKELGSMVVYQLCQSDCIPSHLSQKNSVLIDDNSLKFDIWNIYVSSSSFSSLREERSNGTQVSWSLESYIRRLLKPV